MQTLVHKAYRDVPKKTKGVWTESTEGSGYT